MRDKQNFIKYEQLNRMDIKIEDNRVINILKSKKNSTYRFIRIDLLFSSGIRNDTGQIFIVTNDFKKAKDSLRKEKIYEIVGVINLTEINHQENTKGGSNWVSIIFDE